MTPPDDLDPTTWQELAAYLRAYARAWERVTDTAGMLALETQLGDTTVADPAELLGPLRLHEHYIRDMKVHLDSAQDHLDQAVELLGHRGGGG